jgi:1-acyl-sn-glycerol-3-phosphate acyltransferase
MFLRLIRHLLGWNEMIWVPKENTVLVWTHTTYWDAFIMLFALNHSNVKFVAVCNPKFFNCFTKKFLNYLGFIEAPRLEDRGKNGIDKIIKQLQEIQNQNGPTCLLISPKGTVLNRPWRTGYRYIAEKLKWPIRALILDYEMRSITFSPNVFKPEFLASKEGPDDNTLMQLLHLDLEDSVSLNPDRSEVKVRAHDPFELLSCVDLVCMTNLSFLVPIAKLLFIGDYFLAIIASISFIVSTVYHFHRECKFSDLDNTFARLVIGISLIRYWFNVGPLQLTLLFCSFCALFAAYPRRCFEPRGRYVVYHSLFHILISLTALSLCY